MSDFPNVTWADLIYGHWLTNTPAASGTTWAGLVRASDLAEVGPPTVGGYDRQPLTWTAPATVTGKREVSVVGIVEITCPAAMANNTSVYGVSIHTAVTAGTLIAYCKFVNPIVMQPGFIFRTAGGRVKLRL